MGEFLNGLSVAEQMRRRLYLPEEVNAIFQDFLRTMLTRGKTKVFSGGDGEDDDDGDDVGG